MKAPLLIFVSTLMLGTPAFAQVDQPTAPLSIDAPAWVIKSNQYSRILLDAQASFRPELAPSFGSPEYGLYVTDLQAGHPQRYRTTLNQVRNELSSKLAAEQDPDVRYDLQILMHAANIEIRKSEIEERRLLPWLDVPKLVFEGISNILSDETLAGQRDIALVRLQHYAGLLPGTQPITRLARTRYEEKLSDPTLLPPTQTQIANALASTDRYVDGIRSLFKKYQIEDSNEALYALSMQLHGYAIWTRQNVLPTARIDTQMPSDLYTQALQEYGIDLDPQELVHRAEVAFIETRTAMQQLVPLINKDQGLDVNDYRDVIRMQSQSRTGLDHPRGYPAIDDETSNPIVARERLATAMEYAIRMRLNPGSESAASPPGRMNVTRSTPHPVSEANISISEKRTGSPLLENTTGHGAIGTDGPYLPNNMAEYRAMTERGISLARSMFAFNRVNTEGWPLYAESEMLPYEPLTGQMSALQFRLLRAARAMLDPMLNMGHITRVQAAEVLRDDVQLPESLVKQELERYERLPGQAPSSLYGYHRLQSLRVETELALGDRFDRKAFNDFLLKRMLLLPDQLTEAVRSVFVPSQLRRPANRPNRVALAD